MNRPDGRHPSTPFPGTPVVPWPAGEPAPEPPEGMAGISVSGRRSGWYGAGMVVAVVHLTIAATWLGSMAYSLGVVQPKVTRFFPDEERREEFLLVLAHGNRWRVVALVGALMASAAVTMVTWSRVAAAYAVALVFYAAAAAVFVNVSWRHWPARVFAVRAELEGFRRRLRVQAWAMLVLVGTAFMIALSVSVGVGH